MPWLRTGDTAANHPIVLAPLEHHDVDERLVNEVFGFVSRCALQSTAHLTDYVVNRGTALAIGGFQRADALLQVAIFSGYMTEVQVDLDDGQGTRTAYKIIDDPEFIHMRTREEIEWERQRKSDNSNPALIIPVRLRDGDACRYCGMVVNFRARRGRLAGTYDHREPGREATVDTYVVACGACNSGRSNDPAADTAYPLLPIPRKPYYSPQTIEWIETNEWAISNGYKAPKPPATTIRPGQHSGNGTPGQRYTQSNGNTGSPTGNGRPGQETAQATESVTTGQETASLATESVTPARGTKDTKPAQRGPKPPAAPSTQQNSAKTAERQYAKSGNSGTGRDGSGRDGKGTQHTTKPSAAFPTSPPDQPKRSKRKRQRPRSRRTTP